MKEKQQCSNALQQRVIANQTDNWRQCKLVSAPGVGLCEQTHWRLLSSTLSHSLSLSVCSHSELAGRFRGRADSSGAVCWGGWWGLRWATQESMLEQCEPRTLRPCTSVAHRKNCVSYRLFNGHAWWRLGLLSHTFLQRFRCSLGQSCWFSSLIDEKKLFKL